MKTLVCTEPGKFEYREDEIPVKEKGKAIIKTERIGICGTDLHAYDGSQPYFNYPRVLGHELAGELIEPLEQKDFSKGDHVTIIPYNACGECIACRQGNWHCCANMQVFGVHIDGGMREYISVPEKAVVHGQGISMDELALVEPLSISSHAVNRAAVMPGEIILVTGAGPIGLGCMELAHIAGATVIAMDVNEGRLQFCKEILGVEYIVDAKKDFASQIEQITKGDWPTAIIDATGNAKAIMAGFNLLANGGRYVMVGIQKGDITFNHPEFHKRETTLMSSRNAKREDFEHVISSIKAGKIKVAEYITHRTKFNELKEMFPAFLDPKNNVIKAIVEM